MPVLDQLQTLNDSDSLNSGDMLEFAIGAVCWPFFSPTENEVQAAFQQYAPSITLSGQASNWTKWVTLGWRQAYYAQATGAVQVGTVRGQITNAMGGINAQMTLGCSDWTIDGGTIYQVLQQGTGNVGDILASAGTGVQKTVGQLGGAIGLAALAVIVYFVWRIMGAK